MKETGALVLFSGGLDSTTALYWARGRFHEIEALIISYGQRHRLEVEMARRTLEKTGLKGLVLELPLKDMLNSALLNEVDPIPVSLDASRLESGPPCTYVPFRNGIFLALAAARAETLGYTNLVTGFNRIDSPDYPDTGAAFTRAMEEAMNLGTGIGQNGRKLQIHTPLIDLSKEEIVRLGLELGADYSHSLSCYRGGEWPCLDCAACDVRKRAFSACGLEDPLLGRLKKEGQCPGN